MSEAYGPKVTITRTCDDCPALRSTYYAVQGDSGFHYACAHPVLEAPKNVSEYATPVWCPALAPQRETVRDHHDEAMEACDEQRWADAVEAEAMALARAVRLNTSASTQFTLAKSVIGICTAIQKALTPEPTARCGDCDACMTGQPCNRTILEPRREEG